MEKKTRVAKPRVKKVVDTSALQVPRVSSDDIAKALGAEMTGHRLPTSLTPDSHLTLFEQIASEIVSTGGRPARKERTERRKLPLTAEEWQRLKAIADECSKAGVSVSPAQVGGILLREALEPYRLTVGTMAEGRGDESNSRRKKRKTAGESA